MSDDKQPELTPEQQAAEVTEQQTDDSAQIETVFGATDAYQRMTALMDDIGIGSRGSLFGKTSFEGADLNAMLDLLDQANPSDLENAGRELGKARDALNAAAQELDDYVKSVHWEGESGREFRRYGTELAKYAWGLGTFANKVSTQMEVASTGLTSVRNSKPPRDGRLVRKKAEDFALPERRADNPEYAEAVKVEENRQEAINQMNRLASFYAVSEESLAAQEPPPMPKMLQADVPRPREGGLWNEPAGGAGAEASGAAGQPASRERAETAGVSDSSGKEALGPSPSVPGRNTSMEIDSVAAPPAPSAAAPSASPPPSVSNPGTPPSPVAPLAPSFGAAKNTVPRATGTSGVAKTGTGPAAQAVGRPGASGGSAPAAGRAGATGRHGAAPGGTRPATGNQGPVGRPSGSMGASTATGRAGVMGTPGQTPAGRQGAIGQQSAARTGQTPSSGARTGRADGIVGGTPQRSPAGSPAPRIPLGTVVGAEGVAAGRTSAPRPGQFGVIGASTGNVTQRPTGKGTPSANGVVGTPRNARPVGGSGERQPRDQGRDRNVSARPDNLSEDEQTWSSQRRGAVPPVID
ncbi:hypothetical protein HHX38_27710 [Streptomyces sp. PKU-MA01144]|uniref:hypothetical protein n=1 Tax=Streptomyces TaxID=1883 RepID=UPI00147BD499|nr:MULTISPECIES: hypothetical protein [Streptomyces]MCY0981352.1 hypothetical protein [Streptomyces tirandamycinicus]NNJ07885.1 hypothetical protein [Streptomyces sp. PKU-MA01144]